MASEPDGICGRWSLRAKDGCRMGQRRGARAHARRQTAGPGQQLTAVVVERGEVGLLLGTAGAVAHAHLQLVPRGFLQVIQDVGLGERGPLSRGPDRGPKGSVLEREGGDGAATVVPADEVQPHARGVDAGKELLLLGELGL